MIEQNPTPSFTITGVTARTIAPATGRLGVLLPGLGAVASTVIAGVLQARQTGNTPIGSLSQMSHIRLGERAEGRNPRIKDFVPLATLDDLVFGGWDPISPNALEAARTAGVLEERDIARVSAQLEGVVAMDAVFDKDWVSRLDGTRVKTGTTKMDLAQALMDDIERFRVENDCDRLVMVWCASTEAYRDVTEVHQTVAIGPGVSVVEEHVVARVWSSNDVGVLDWAPVLFGAGGTSPTYAINPFACCKKCN